MKSTLLNYSHETLTYLVSPNPRVKIVQQNKLDKQTAELAFLLDVSP